MENIDSKENLIIQLGQADKDSRLNIIKTILAKYHTVDGQIKNINFNELRTELNRTDGSFLSLDKTELIKCIYSPYKDNIVTFPFKKYYSVPLEVLFKNLTEYTPKFEYTRYNASKFGIL